jgi:hypothetical protein
VYTVNVHQDMADVLEDMVRVYVDLENVSLDMAHISYDMFKVPRTWYIYAPRRDTLSRDMVKHNSYMFKVPINMIKVFLYMEQFSIDMV